MASPFPNENHKGSLIHTTENELHTDHKSHSYDCEKNSERRYVVQNLFFPVMLRTGGGATFY